MLAYAVCGAEYINIQTYMIMNGVYCAEQNSWGSEHSSSEVSLYTVYVASSKLICINNAWRLATEKEPFSSPKTTVRSA